MVLFFIGPGLFSRAVKVVSDKCGGELEGIAFGGQAVGVDLGEGVADTLLAGLFQLEECGGGGDAVCSSEVGRG